MNTALLRSLDEGGFPYQRPLVRTSGPKSTSDNERRNYVVEFWKQLDDQNQAQAPLPYLSFFILPPQALTNTAKKADPFLLPLGILKKEQNNQSGLATPEAAPIL